MKCQGSESQNIIKQEVNSNHEGQETDRQEMMRQHIDSTDMKSQMPSSSITITAEVYASDIKSQVTDTQRRDVPQMLTSNMNGGNMELSGTDNNYNGRIYSAYHMQNVQMQTPFQSHPLPMESDIDYYMKSRERNLNNFIASEIQSTDKRRSEALMALQKKKLLDKAFMESISKLDDTDLLRSFSLANVLDGEGNPVSTEEILNLESAHNNDKLLYINVGNMDEEDYAKLRITLLERDNEDNSKIQCEGTFFPGKRYQSSKVTYRMDKRDEELKKRTNGRLESNAEENSRIFKKPQGALDILNAFRGKGSKAVVSPLPGSQAKQTKEKEKSVSEIDLTGADEMNPEANTDWSTLNSKDYTDITYGR